MARFFEKKMPTKTISHLMSPEKRAKTIKTMVVGTMRVFAIFLLVMGFKIKKDMRRDVQRREEEMLE